MAARTRVERWPKFNFGSSAEEKKSYFLILGPKRCPEFNLRHLKHCCTCRIWPFFVCRPHLKRYIFLAHCTKQVILPKQPLERTCGITGSPNTLELVCSADSVSDYLGSPKNKNNKKKKKKSLRPPHSMEKMNLWKALLIVLVPTVCNRHQPHNWSWQARGTNLQAIIEVWG